MNQLRDPQVAQHKLYPLLQAQSMAEMANHQILEIMDTDLLGAMFLLQTSLKPKPDLDPKIPLQQAKTLV
jgi:hypothetical protein